MGALLGPPSGTPTLAGQQAGAEPLAILRPQAASIHQRPPLESGNIVGQALLRKIALNLVRADTTLKASLKGKRKSAAWDNSFMAALMAG